MNYKVITPFRGLKTSTNYEVGDKVKDEDFHLALLNSNNQYHQAFVEEAGTDKVEESSAKVNLSELKVDELKEKAKALGIDDFSSMKKAELIVAIEAVQD
ncbi:hypothetical protein HMPREF2626_01585 [Aerococcus sp. HMSC062A02]|uniref:Rho termination factor N-terminal domain-containing protein n=1 Tax=Aerococcus sp. HMSC062A02 TaxID=1715105 RepID=UPI0008A26671|nr:Rho termination factor N-terminal domain-containing protein [Aerococcus sp. HMSC062A02]OFN02629.1 hypothetical protein HMPREF2626_01585 [Aerococcus sp. HMSC062A02]